MIGIVAVEPVEPLELQQFSVALPDASAGTGSIVASELRLDPP